MSIKKGDLVAMSDRQTKDGCGFTDPTTGWSISPGDKKPLPNKISQTLQARINSGAIISAGRPGPDPQKPPEGPGQDKKDKDPGPLENGKGEGGKPDPDDSGKDAAPKEGIIDNLKSKLKSGKDDKKAKSDKPKEGKTKG